VSNLPPPPPPRVQVGRKIIFMYMFLFEQRAGVVVIDSLAGLLAQSSVCV
jgi:hypothetical protein